MSTLIKPEAEADWLAVAARASVELARSTHGRKRPLASRLAAEAGMSEGLLRRAIAAHRFFETLERDGVAVPATLRAAPIGVVDIVSRWAEHDPDGAFAAGKAYVAGEVTFRELLKQEITARPATLKARPARMLDVRLAWKDAVLAKLPRITAFKGARIEKSGADDPPIDGWVVDKASGRHRGAVVVVGPYKSQDEYLRDQTTWVLRTMGLAQVVDDIHLVVPGPEAASAYRKMLERWPLRSGRIMVVPLSRPPALADFIDGRLK